jgi:hypothetical protein
MDRTKGNKRFANQSQGQEKGCRILSVSIGSGEQEWFFTLQRDRRTRGPIHVSLSGVLSLGTKQSPISEFAVGTHFCNSVNLSHCWHILLQQ